VIITSLPVNFFLIVTHARVLVIIEFTSVASKISSAYI